ncbi:MAG: class IV adenylate cyclase [Pyrinomonadaceae bacterium]
MAIELEKKYRLGAGARSAITSRLQLSGAVFEGDQFEENVIFDLSALTGRPGILRIRKTAETTLLTLKRRIAAESDIKIQMEHETEVSDGDAIRQIVFELGLVPACIYEKRRSIWTLFEAEIALDVLSFGEYMEIEGSEESIAKVEIALDAVTLDAEHRTYPRLTVENGIRIGGVFESRFDN